MKTWELLSDYRDLKEGDKMKRRKRIYPGDSVYYDEEGRIFKKAGKGRIYLGESSLENKKPMKEGKKVILR